MADSEAEPDSNSDSDSDSELAARWSFLGPGPDGLGLEVGPLQKNPEKAETEMPCLVLDGPSPKTDGGASFP